MPNIVFSKGGPGAFVVVLIAWYYRIPIVIHDSDAIPGRTTRWTENKARKILLAFQNAMEYLIHKERAVIVGNPIRKNLAIEERDRGSQEKQLARTALGFSSSRPLILVLGGSQGAETLNNFVIKNLEKLVAKYQVLHQTGVLHFTEIRGLANESYRPVPFLQDDMKRALLSADLAISRAGAGAIFEIAAARIPAILVPIDNSANNHQKENAFQYEKAGACVVIEEENLFGEIVISAIDGILENLEKKKLMVEAAARFAKPNATQHIAQEILSILSS